jgi:hypothetical protein
MGRVVDSKCGSLCHLLTLLRELEVYPHGCHEHHRCFAELHTSYSPTPDTWGHKEEYECGAHILIDSSFSELLCLIFQKLDINFQNFPKQMFRPELHYFIWNDFSDSKLNSKLNTKWTLGSFSLHRKCWYSLYWVMQEVWIWLFSNLKSRIWNNLLHF